MGCSGSRLGHGQAGVVLPPRLRPLFLLRLEEFRMRRRHVRPIKDSSSTNSKIILLHVQRDDDDENTSDSVGTKLYEEKQEEGEEHGKPKLEEVCEKINVKDHVKIKEESEFEDALTDAYKSNNDGDDHDDDDEDDGRMIGHSDGEAFPASPSFRVYFKDVGEEKHNDLGEVKNNKAFNSRISGDDDDNEILSYKNKKVKKGRKRKSFKKVLPKGGQTAVKNLLTINLCYSTPPSPSPSPHHHHRHRRNHSVT